MSWFNRLVGKKKPKENVVDIIKATPEKDVFHVDVKPKKPKEYKNTLASNRRQLSSSGELLIKDFEKLKLIAYKPHADDVWTIGWGTTRGVNEGMKIDIIQAQKMFDDDISVFSKVVTDYVKVELNQNQFDALVSLVYNIGETQFRKSTLLKFLNQGKYDKVPAEFERWKFSAGKIWKGLIIRRAREANLFKKSTEI